MTQDIDNFLGNIYEQFEEVCKENVLKLEQILNLEKILWDTRILMETDGSPCWCCMPTISDGEVGHEEFCAKARTATEPFWKGVKKSNDTESIIP